MNNLRIPIVGALIVAFAAVLPSNSEEASKEPPAPLFDNLGKHHHKVTAGSRKVQRYFDQGLTLCFGFNHAEAIRSFKEAAKLDPNCAMAYWGIAYALGPNINIPMDDAVVPEAYAAIQQAVALKGKVSEKEAAYIDALAVRYAPEPVEDRGSLDQAYADAMKHLVDEYPDDLDAAALYVESLLDLSPWNFWTKDGDPHPRTEEFVALLESILDRNPKHPAACHFYIHAVEASNNPGRAEKAADTLGGLCPGAGHLVHMPAHIYIRIGRYQDAIDANVKADAADDAYVAQCRAQGVYPLVYHPHNTHFLYAAAAMAGNSGEAIRAAGKTAILVKHTPSTEVGMEFLQHFVSMPLYSWVRFGWWEEILVEPSPPPDALYALGVWRYARGIALARTGRPVQAQTELGALNQIAKNEAQKSIQISPYNSADEVLAVAVEVLAGEVDAANKNVDAAIQHLESALELENALHYNEPTDWFLPVRHSLGAVLLEFGKPEMAEAVYRDDLKANPENGWALLGLEKSLRALNRNDEAEDVTNRLEKAWANADVKPESSRI